MRDPNFSSEFAQQRRQFGATLPGPYESEFGTPPSQEIPDEYAEKVTKTGTTTVGITTAEGVVLATDMRASLGGRFVSNKNVQKVEQIHPTAAMTMAGAVGGAQSFFSTIRAEQNLYETRRGKPMTMEGLSTLAGNILRGGPFFLVSPILGGVDDDGYHIYSMDPSGSVLADDYTVTGSGMQMAYGVLENEFEKDMSMEEAKSLAARGINSSIERDTASGNGIFLAEITEEGVDIVGHKDYDELL
jgi:proteasome beta subunit